MFWYLPSYCFEFNYTVKNPFMMAELFDYRSNSKVTIDFSTNILWAGLGCEDRLQNEVPKTKKVQKNCVWKFKKWRSSFIKKDFISTTLRTVELFFKGSLKIHKEFRKIEKAKNIEKTIKKWIGSERLKKISKNESTAPAPFYHWGMFILNNS